MEIGIELFSRGAMGLISGVRQTGISDKELCALVEARVELLKSRLEEMSLAKLGAEQNRFFKRAAEGDRLDSTGYTLLDHGPWVEDATKGRGLETRGIHFAFDRGDADAVPPGDRGRMQVLFLDERARWIHVEIDYDKVIHGKGWFEEPKIVRLNYTTAYDARLLGLIEPDDLLYQIKKVVEEQEQRHLARVTSYRDLLTKFAIEDGLIAIRGLPLSEIST